jgi:hypothetical protein
MVNLLSFPFAQGWGIKFEYRATDGANAQDASAEVQTTAARWLKLVRVGASFTAYYSLTGTSWTQIGSTVSVTLGGAARAGIYTGSQNAGVPASASFANVSVQNLAAATYTDSSAITGTDYSYRVRARDQAGNVSAQSAAVSVSSNTADRWGMYWIGGDFTNQYQSAAGIANMARRQVVILNGWPELQAARGVSNQTIAAAVKAASTVGTKLFGYYNPEAIEDPPSGVRVTQYNQINSANWWAYVNGSSGTRVDSYFSTAQTSVVPTNNTTPADSLYAPEWITRHSRDWWIGGAESNTAAPDMDGLFMDNVLLFPRVDADWDRDGSTDFWQRNITTAPPPSTTAPYRQGWKRAATWFRANEPTRYLFGNNADFWLSRLVGGYGWPVPDLDQELHGGVWEFLLNLNDPYYTGAELAQYYRDLYDSLRAPQWLIVEHHSITNSPNDHQSASYGFAFCRVCGDGYYDYVQQDGHANHEWFDWMDYRLGAASEARVTAATDGTAWRRGFTNAIVIWWPRGSTSTVTLGGTFYALRGDGARWLTPGQSLTNITPPSDRNGIILSRTPT